MQLQHPRIAASLSRQGRTEAPASARKHSCSSGLISSVASAPRDSAGGASSVSTRAATVDRANASKAAVSSTYVTPEARKALFNPAKEQAEEAACSLVSGSLPAWLNGSLFFNGCGEYTGMDHLFDGYSVLVKLRFSEGQAYGRQRYLDSDAYRHFKSTGRMRYREFATAPKAQGLGGALLGLYDTLSAAAGTRVHVVALDGSGVVTHTAPPFFTFHFSNAFERPTAAANGGSGSEICVDLSVYDDPQIINDLRVDNLTAFPGGEISPSRLARLTIPLTDASGAPAGPTTLAAPAPLLRDDAAYGNYIEFCAFNPEYKFKPYRYTYGTAAVRPTNMANALAQHDTEAGTSRVWHEPGSMLSEPSFVPRPGATEEADGVVLSLLTRGDGGGSQLLVLDGRTFTETARLQLPFAVPFRFHGAFVQGQQ
ncbi:hypothetical protein CHLRE_08g365851v5 [Chlamydomonas reinhardtii]|uniref:Uncharacterized protein n=1 Tax=Chlamydomonas reinhardtii TaxID=3055 RepID=A0A2K3DGX4_CHLRE|nr:uncharacterized protein CHLRE_08g365851v5 [Chlamydomonas reinhardtii]PNW79769.1 hypothetical protein CHLRE_08g365851v5 [Chlamydomonas reinhardtii]